MKKRILSVILCMAILLTTFMSVPITTSAYYNEYDFEIDGVLYAQIDDSNVEIVGYNPDTLPEDIVIPSIIQDKTVTGVKFPGFGDAKIKSIELPNTVTYLDYYAFSSCFSLEKVTILGDITSISKFTFWDCYKLKEVNLPDSVEYISERAFSECKSLESIDLPANLQSIGTSVFEGCISLKQITINPALQTISPSAFANLPALTDVIFEERTARLSIEHSAFINCTSLKNFDFSYNLSIDINAFMNCTSLSSVIMSEDAISSLSYSSFQGCTNLEKVKLADIIKSIPNSCFSGCISLESIETAPLIEVGYAAFSNCNNLTDISFAKDNSISTVDDKAFMNCSKLTEIDLSSVKYIENSAFENCTALTKVNLEGNTKLVSIGAGAFGNCTSLEKIDIPSSCKEICETAFMNCYSLSEVTLREGLEEIGQQAFFNCYNLYQIFIPNSVKLIEAYALACFEYEGEVYSYSDFTVLGSPDSLADEYAEMYMVTYEKALPAPKLTSISNTDSGVKLSFEKLSGVSGYYRVYRKTAGTSWTKLADVTSASYTDTTATAGTKYTYTVKFIGNDGTNSLYDKTGLSITRLKTPSVTKIENVENGAKITFGAVAGATKYRVYVKTSTDWKGIGDTSSTSIVHTDAVSGTSYTYTVKAFDSDGLGSAHNSTGWSNKFIATPFIKNAEVTNSGVKLTWDKVVGAENYKYRVFIKNGSSWKTLANVSSETTSYVDKTATVGNTYTYTIRIVDSNNKYVSGYEKDGFTINYLEAPQITGFENVKGGTVISWNEVEGASKYRLYIKKDGSWTKIADVSGTSYTHTDLEDSTEYTYTIRCITEDSKTLLSGFDSTGFTNLYEEPEVTVLTGDADLDGEISVLDASLIQLYLVGKKELTDDALVAADADLDGEISVLDASLIQLMLVGKK